MDKTQGAYGTARQSRPGDPPLFVAGCSSFPLLDDRELFKAAKWFQRKRDLLRREFTKRGCGTEATVYCDTPPLEKLDEAELNALGDALSKILGEINGRLDSLQAKGGDANET